MIKRMWSALTTMIDMRDLFFFAGLGLLMTGLARLSVTYALIGGGAVLLLAALRR